MGGNFATRTDLNALLDLHEGADLGFIADFAAVEIDEAKNTHALADFDIGGDLLVSGPRLGSLGILSLFCCLAAAWPGKGYGRCLLKRRINKHKRLTSFSFKFETV